MDEPTWRSLRALAAAMQFQERVLTALNAGLDQLTTREQELLDACMQVYLDDLRPDPGSAR